MVFALAGLAWALVPDCARAADPSETDQPEVQISADAPPPKTQGHKPWRMYEAIESPPFLFFRGTQRTRFEQVLNQFRAGRPGDDRILAMRTNLLAELKLKRVRFGVELSDARAYLFDRNTPIDTNSVNTLALLRAYMHIRVPNAVIPDATAHVQIGRLTLDVGSRRFVARNRYRNTINGFTGFDAEWETPIGLRLRGFATLPIRRLPREEEAARDRAVRLDRENLGAVLWGLFFASPPVLTDTVIEAFLFGLHERDTRNQATLNRILVTPGFRIARQPRPGRIDFEIETAAQLGTSRQTLLAEDEEDLQHRAFFQHASVGYTWRVPAKPRISIAYDFASGDGDPNDKVNGRFDPLFGARRFEFGPTGIYGAFARSNIHSPGARIELKPLDNVSAFAAYRLFWLASSRDAWTTSGLRDDAGTAGSFLGQQFEARLRFDILVGNLRLETGIAHLLRGRFAREAPNANEGGAPTVFYTQWEVIF